MDMGLDINMGHQHGQGINIGHRTHELRCTSHVGAGECSRTAGVQWQGQQPALSSCHESTAESKAEIPHVEGHVYVRPGGLRGRTAWEIRDEDLPPNDAVCTTNCCKAVAAGTTSKSMSGSSSHQGCEFHWAQRQAGDAEAVDAALDSQWWHRYNISQTVSNGDVCSWCVVVWWCGRARLLGGRRNLGASQYLAFTGSCECVKACTRGSSTVRRQENCSSHHVPVMALTALLWPLDMPHPATNATDFTVLSSPIGKWHIRNRCASPHATFA